MRMRTRRFLGSLIVVLFFAGRCAVSAEPPAPDADALLGHIKVLASDDFEGRAPGTPGERKSVDYLVEQFRKLGLKPGNPDGTYVQEVPLIGFRAAEVKGTLRVGETRIPLKFTDDWVAVSRGNANGSSSTIPTSCSSATAWSRPSMVGTIIRESTCAARRSSC